jgi:DNA-binding NarL/FixJ family response regulator
MGVNVLYFDEVAVMRERYTVVIAEDHTILREGLKALLNASDDLRVTGEAKDGLDAIRCIKEKTPDIALLDLSMPKMGGISVIKEIAVAVPETKIVALTMHSEEEFALEAFKSGAKGYCLKTSCHNELLFAIRSVLSGKTYVSPEISDKILEGYLDSKKRLKTKSCWDTLTRREIEVLKLIGEGYRNKEIAEFLCISVKTVEKHRANIMQKLDLHNASALTAYAIDKGLVVK